VALLTCGLFSSMHLLQTFGEPQHLPYRRIQDSLIVRANLSRPAYDLRPSKWTGTQSSLPRADL
jgi:hypothetical protein